MKGNCGFKRLLQIYYDNIEIGSKEVTEIFGIVSRSSIAHYKNIALKKMVEKGVPQIKNHMVNTKAAFDAWGIDINDVEERFRKQKELGIIK